MTYSDVLDGHWLTATDPHDRGRNARWERAAVDHAVRAHLPGVLQEVFPGYHGLVWYWRDIMTAPAVPPGDRYEIAFQDVSYAATVWIDGQLLGSHFGAGSFALDITSRLTAPGAHIVAVRVLNPCDERIDGIVLSETPHGNAVMDDQFWPGRGYNYGGITGQVEIRHRRAVELVDVFTRPDLSTGQVDIGVTVDNAGSAQVPVRLSVHLYLGNRCQCEETADFEVPIGRTEHTSILHLAEPEPWSPDRPVLYQLTLLLTVPGGSAPQIWHQQIGFREFSVGPDGAFRLNGARCYLRSTHTGNHTPAGIGRRRTAALIRQDLVYAKAIGLNMVRFIAGPATPEQLDLCDELGLLVYQETRAAWLLASSDDAADRFDDELRALVLRDRSHPSMAVWGLLNETGHNAVFEHAVEALSVVRELDLTRLVLLGSGRWDGDLSIGSVANPYQNHWQPLWGEEGLGGDRAGPEVRGYVEHVGDRHFYPTVPQTAASDLLLREMGDVEGRVFLSEYGIGSLFNVVTELRALEQAGAAMETAEPRLMRGMLEQYLADWERFGLSALYAFPEDLLEESQARHAEHRRHGLNLIRANPSVIGHNITGMLDHAVTGEGLWTFGRRWKTGVVDAVSDGLAPVRWCLFVSPRHGYPGIPTRVEIVLANDSALAAGRYLGLARLSGASRWEESFEFEIADGDPYAIPVLDRTLPDLGAGEYRLAVGLSGKAAPVGGRLTFRRSDVARPLDAPVDIDCLGCAASTLDWLGRHNVHSHSRMTGRRPLLIGPDLPADDPVWPELRHAVAHGARLALLAPYRQPEAVSGLLGPQVQVAVCDEWLYHSECVAFDHPLFAGLPAGGILDWYFYDQVLPHHVLRSTESPADRAAVSVCVGHPGPGGYRSGYVAGTWRVGRGSVFASTLQIAENVEGNPAAGSLLVNVVRLLVAE